jgi:hypothetical protein
VRAAGPAGRSPLWGAAHPPRAGRARPMSGPGPASSPSGPAPSRLGWPSPKPLGPAQPPLPPSPAASGWAAWAAWELGRLLAACCWVGRRRGWRDVTYCRRDRRPMWRLDGEGGGPDREGLGAWGGAAEALWGRCGLAEGACVPPYMAEGACVPPYIRALEQSWSSRRNLDVSGMPKGGS